GLGSDSDQDPDGVVWASFHGRIRLASGAPGRAPSARGRATCGAGAAARTRAVAVRHRGADAVGPLPVRGEAPARNIPPRSVPAPEARPIPERPGGRCATGCGWPVPSTG